MRIIGGRDFYDTAIAFGRDESIVFERNSGRILTAHEAHDEYGIPRRQPGFEVHDAESKPRNLGHRLFPLLRRTTQEINLGHTRITCAPQHVLFCGVLYSGIVVTIIKSWPHHQEEHRFWKAEAFRQFCKSHGLSVNDTASSVVKDQRLDGRGLHQQVNVHLESLDDFFTPLPIARDRLGRMIAERITILARIPGGWGRDSTWSVNGCELSAMGFAKALDPHSAFQEISMWIGGVLGAENPNIVEITDDRVKAEKHGFHHPTSFRRSKGASDLPCDERQMMANKYDGVGFFEQAWKNPPAPFNPKFDPKAKDRYAAVTKSMEDDDYYASHTREECRDEWRRRYEEREASDAAALN